LWFGRSISDAVDEPRVHTKLVPDDSSYVEKDFPNEIRKGLEDRNHVIKTLKYYAAVQAITADSRGAIYAKSDKRKGGKPGGF
jgi:gamma-glutamyltranspeptidase/glutathione hydrolase/leukotriene-C4 hydrolase